MQHKLLKLFKNGIQSVDPTLLIKNNVKINNAQRELRICNQIFQENVNVHVIGFGKAVHKMAIALQEVLTYRIKSGILSIPHINENVNISPIRVYKGALNNLPDENSLFATDEIIKLVKNIPKEDVVVVLISGGGSSLLTKPVRNITLNDKLLTIKLLVNSGATISELNTIRKCLSQVKGGGLGKELKNNTTVCLLLSDVVGNPLDVIASGPVIENSDSKNDAMEIVRKYKLELKIPKHIMTIIRDPEINSNLKPNNISHVIVGSNEIALKSIRDFDEAKTQKIILSSKIEGLVQGVSEAYIELTKYIVQYLANKEGKAYQNIRNWIRKNSSLQIENDFLVNFAKVCDSEMDTLIILMGGETTVKLNGCGKGGRNQELAVLFSEGLHEMKDELGGFDVSILCGGTDGIDGPTDAAGAFGNLQLIEEGMKMGLNVENYLANNDTYSYLAQVLNGDNLIKIGHTGTNVMDIHMIAFTKKI